MAKKTIVIDPVTRIEGHLKIEVEVENGKVTESKSSGTMVRGFEIILKGRDPRDAQHITQRVCGVCPASHAMAASLTLDSAFGVTPPKNGRIIRNLVLGSNFLQSHILHFYHLAALDFVLGPDSAPFVPRYKGDYRLSKEINDKMVSHYISALDIRRKSHEMLAIFGGKMPHHVSFVPGGVTEKPTVDNIASFLWRLREIKDFVNQTYIPDVLAIEEAYREYKNIGIGCKNLIAYRTFDLDDKKGKSLFKQGRYTNDKYEDFSPEEIYEDCSHSWYSDETSGKNPASSETELKPDKAKGYSWIKSPRYMGIVHEVGPLARMWINGEYRDGISVIDRHKARALEAKKICEAMEEWVLQLEPGKPVFTPHSMPKDAQAMGLTGAPRGALGHWMTISDYKISRYQIITPTAWNASPRDDKDQPGPVDQALIGTSVADSDNPIEIVRVVRSFDPCLACSVHLIKPSGELKRFTVC